MNDLEKNIRRLLPGPFKPDTLFIGALSDIIGKKTLTAYLMVLHFQL